jgi:spore coat polysaccharide biosynthesis predicted glycosyltransferase SpsG
MLQKELLNLKVTYIEVPFIDYPAPDSRLPEDEVPFDMDKIICKGDLVVLDGYWFGYYFQSATQSKGAKVAVIDDMGDRRFHADAIINPTPGLMHLYTSISIPVYNGFDYIFLRSPFFDIPLPKNHHRNGLFICLGATDFQNITSIILQQLIRFKSYFSEAHILVPNPDTADELTLKIQHDPKFSFHYQLNASEIIAILDHCDKAIVSSSTIALEVISRNIKPLIGYYTANQTYLYDALCKSDFATGLGKFESKKHLTQDLELYLQNEHTFTRPLLPSNNHRLIECFNQILSS